MSLRTKLKIDAAKAQKGVGYSLAEYPNEDGTIPVFFISSTTKHNVAFQKAQREFGLDLVKRGVIKEDGKIDSTASELAASEVEQMYDTIFVENAIIGWENFQPFKEGQNTPFTIETALKVLLDPEWSELLTLLRDFASNLDNFRAQAREKAAKN